MSPRHPLLRSLAIYREMPWRFALVAGLSMLLGRALNQDAWVIGHHPAVSELAELWTQLYEQEGAQTAQNFLEKRKKRYRVDTQVLDDSGRSLVYGTFPPRAAAFEARQDNPQRLPWRRLTEEGATDAASHDD